MKIILYSDELKKLQRFVSKKESIVINGIMFNNNNGFLEMVATDGKALLLIRRKLGSAEELTGSIVLKFPLELQKGGITLFDRNGDIFLRNNGADFLCQKVYARFPDYQDLCENWDKLPEASDYVMFASECIKKLELVQKTFITPKAKNRYSPHFFGWHEFNGTDYLVVLMPLRK